MSEKITVKWLGHASFKISKDDYSIVLDPFKPSSVPGLKDINETANEVLCSHEHYDHNYREAVKIISGKKSPFTVTEINTFHDDEHGAKRGPNIIRVFESDGVKVVHFGDLGCNLTDEQINLLKGADCVLIPVGGFFTIDAQKAQKIVEQIEAKVVIPMHYRTADFGFDVIANINDFLDICGRWVRYPSNTIEIGHEDKHYCCVLTLGK